MQIRFREIILLFYSPHRGEKRPTKLGSKGGFKATKKIKD